MTKPIALAVLVLLLAHVAGPVASAADQDRGLIVQEQERTFFERATALHRNIKEGWSHEAVAGIMVGPPNATRHAQDGSDYVETWWYHDYEVGIEFRNGAVSHWFFRFMLR